ncbi:putative ALA-interacting subunit 2-like isoform X1 [Hibiscus syriacus]|uniref:ALA-interacting subunit 2-like isoform X1 n=1 Tax=Hibiscus syriacus TaxID=106335 RepID=A0A6A2YRT6_HIBSY|nr:putative ALA-interacting subunit 2-like isoform X1 [Hibiscus syriacus]
MFTAIPAISSIRQLKSIGWGKQMRAYVMTNDLGYQVENCGFMELNDQRIGALEQVKALHGCSLKLGPNLLSSINSAILIGYAKCGCIVLARKLFDEERIDVKDIITWNSIIDANAKHEDWSQCFKLYNRMKRLNLKLDQVTFLGLLTAWRAGRIDVARELLNEMPFKPDTRVWGPLLSACKLHLETKLAESAAEKLLTMEPENAGNYVLLSNMYAVAGKWDKFAKMMRLLKEKGLKKVPGCSWIQLNGHVHEFLVADKSHPKANEIYALLGILEFSIKEAREYNCRESGLSPEVNTVASNSVHPKPEWTTGAVKAENYWEQRARVNWLKNGDNNTGFFQRYASQRKRQNYIRSLENERGDKFDSAQKKYKTAPGNIFRIYSLQNSKQQMRKLWRIHIRASLGNKREFTKIFHFRKCYKSGKGYESVKMD